mmetsp:Transcript_472/g.1027  ORF Transcript_472/g.1027 Transcript_472/m.1027 type:complete len:215 (-) Transcript_472:551-1195(-)
MTSASERTSLTRTVLTIVIARLAKRSVCEVSSACSADGLTVAMTAVRALPPRLGCRIRVSLEFLKGMWSTSRPSASFPITLPSIRRLRLICALSSARVPVFSVFSSRSLPARSTKLRMLTRSGEPALRHSVQMRKTVCDRDDASFIFVAAVCRRDIPRSISTFTRPTLSTTSSCRPATFTPCTGSSLIWRRWPKSPWWRRCAWLGAPRSRISSL